MDSNFWNGFRDIPAEYTHSPFWFLNDKVDGDEWNRQIDEMARKGVRQAMPHPRYGMDRREYLTDKYFEEFGKLVEHAHEKGFLINLYDEFNWSSGNAGAKLTAVREQCALGISMLSCRVQGPAQVRLGGWEKGYNGWGSFEDVLLAAYAPCTGDHAIDDEKQTVADARWEEGELVFEVPEGDFLAYAVYTIRTQHPSPLRQGNGAIVDYLNPDVTRKFIDLTHEQYYRHFGEHFGKTIPSIFYDEVGPYASGYFTWTQKFDEVFREEKGYSLIPHLPLFFVNGGKHTPKVRCDYWDVLSRMYCENFLGQIQDWCHDHNIAFTGHAHEDSLLWTMNGHLMRALRRQDWVGMDSLVGYKKYSTLKPAISAAHISGSEVMLCEALGLLGGWSCSPRMMRKAYNQLAIAGVNFLVPHAFFQSVDNPKAECPPSFFENNPYWRHYEDIARMTDRQCYVNRHGHHVADAAVYYPVTSWWALCREGRRKGFPWSIQFEAGPLDWLEEAQTFDDLMDAMVADHIDLDIVDDEALAEAEVKDGCLYLKNEAYRCLVLPPMTTIRHAELELLLKAARGGVPVFALKGFAPVNSMENGADDETIKAMVKELLALAIRAEDLPGMTAAIRSHMNCDIQVLEGDGDKLDTAHRQIGDMHIYLLSNTDEQPQSFRLALSASAAHSVLLDPFGCRMDADIRTEGCCAEDGCRNGGAVQNGTTSLNDNSARNGFGCLASLTLPGETLCYLVLSESPLPDFAPALPDAPTEAHDISADLAFLPMSKDGGAAQQEEFLLPVPVLRTRDMEYEVSYFEEELSYDWAHWMLPDYDDSAWEEGALKRGPLLYDHWGSRMFRIPIPAGAAALRLPLPISCEYALYINGELVRVVNGFEDQAESWLPISGCEDKPGVMGVECSSMAPDFGFTAAPVFRVKRRSADLQSWTQWGMSWYSGFGDYTAAFALDELPEQIQIDLGDVRECAEVYVNGQSVGHCIWPPYRLDITPYVQTGKNSLRVVVCNLISNEYSWDHMGHRGDGEVLESGLLGPVKLLIK